MKTFEKVLEIFREYLDCDLEEEVSLVEKVISASHGMEIPATVWMDFSAGHRTNYSRCCYLIIAAMRNCG